MHLVKQLATARSKSFKASTADEEGVPLARCIDLQKSEGLKIQYLLGEIEVLRD